MGCSGIGRDESKDGMMTEAQYKTDIELPLPDIWVRLRDYSLNSGFLPSFTLSIGASLAPGTARTLSPLEVDNLIKMALRKAWTEQFADDWAFQVYEHWTAAREQSPLADHFLMFYDNTDPLKGTKGSVRFTFDDRDAALMFKLSWIAQ